MIGWECGSECIRVSVIVCEYVCVGLGECVCVWVSICVYVFVCMRVSIFVCVCKMFKYDFHILLGKCPMGN